MKTTATEDVAKLKIAFNKLYVSLLKKGFQPEEIFRVYDEKNPQVVKLTMQVLNEYFADKTKTKANLEKTFKALKESYKVRGFMSCFVHNISPDEQLNDNIVVDCGDEKVKLSKNQYVNGLCRFVLFYGELANYGHLQFKKGKLGLYVNKIKEVGNSSEIEATKKNGICQGIITKDGSYYAAYAYHVVLVRALIALGVDLSNAVRLTNGQGENRILALSSMYSYKNWLPNVDNEKFIYLEPEQAETLVYTFFALSNYKSTFRGQSLEQVLKQSENFGWDFLSYQPTFDTINLSVAKSNIDELEKCANGVFDGSRIIESVKQQIREINERESQN